MMKKSAICIFALCLLTGCTDSQDAGEMPAIVILCRTDHSDELHGMTQEEIEAQEIVVRSLAFYDSDGNCYISDDPDVWAMDNLTLAAEYKAGHLTEQLRYSRSCDPQELAEQYAKLQNTCLNEEFTICYPEEMPDVEASWSAWYGYYYDQDHTLQYQTIHVNKCMTHINTDNDAINEVYDWYASSLQKEILQ